MYNIKNYSDIEIVTIKYSRYLIHIEKYIYYSYCVLMSVLASWRIIKNAVIYPSHSLFDTSPTWTDDIHICSLEKIFFH